MSSYSKAEQLGKKKEKPTGESRKVHREARARQAVPGGYSCEYCGGFIKSGDEHGHHVVYGGNHGRKTEKAEDIAIVHGDFTREQCHGLIHQKGVKSREEYPAR